MQTLGAVLAGGQARRLGGAKAIAELAGKPLVAYPLEALRAAGLDAVVVAKRDSPLPPLEVPVVIEPDEPQHPLAGVAAALRHAEGRSVLICACDTPLVTPATLKTLAASGRTTVARTAERAHPLLALYTADVLAPLEQAMKTGDSATHAAESLEPDPLDVADEEIFNVNTPADLVRAEAILKRLRL